MTELLLIRHGQIDANVSQHWHGSTDSPLNDIGRGQVERLRSHLRETHPDITAAYSSPLVRTHHTALGALADHPVDVTPHAGLREWGIGELEGLHYRELMNQHRFMERVLADLAWMPPGGESMGAVIDRMVETLETIAASHPGEKIAVVTHGMAMALALARLIDDDHTRFNQYVVGNCSLTHVTHDAGPRIHDSGADAIRAWSMLRFADSSHLED